MVKVFAGFDMAGFWEPSEYALKEYIGAPLTDEAVAAVERELGYKLPTSYVEFMRFQNGGIPCRTNHRAKERTSWSHDHIAITGLYSIGGDKPCSLLGEFGSSFWTEEWGYPPIGVYFADCPSAGPRHGLPGLPGVRADGRTAGGPHRPGVGLQDRGLGRELRGVHPRLGGRRRL